LLSLFEAVIATGAVLKDVDRVAFDSAKRFVDFEADERAVVGKKPALGSRYGNHRTNFGNGAGEDCGGIPKSGARLVLHKTENAAASSRF
jgi:hypothetical protein